MLHPFALLTLAAACWGFGTVVSKQALDQFEPVPLLIVQLSVSVLAVALFHWWHLRRLTEQPSQRPSIRAAALGVLNPGIAYALGLAGLATITASTAVVLWASEPALIALLAVVILRERLTALLSVALVIALSGMVLVVYSGDLAGNGVGVALTFGAVLACAIYTVLARVLVVDTSAVRVTLYQQLAALAFAFVFAGAVLVAIDGSWIGLGEVTASGWVIAVVSGVLYYGLAFAFYLTALQRVPASVAGLFLTLVPVFGLSGAIITGESLEPHQWVGAALVVGSVALVATTTGRGSRGRRPQPDREAPPVRQDQPE